ncbi:MAG TPA: hypothetical protein VM889_09190 [Candidatus Thermoplasmatota archaeon]|nr:hypothetical protein [Candidatus Thermoplasmatota archaeon]
MQRLLACLLALLALLPAATAQSNPHEMRITLDTFRGQVTPGERAVTNATIEITCSAAAMVSSGQARLQVAFFAGPPWATPAAPTSVRVDPNACDGKFVRVRAPLGLDVAREAPAFVAETVKARATLTTPTASAKAEAETVAAPHWRGDFDAVVDGPIEVAPGGQSILVVRVTNRANAVTEYTLEPEHVPEGWSVVPPAPRDIPAAALGGSGITDELRVTIGSPGSGGALKGDLRFVIRAVPSVDPTAGEVSKPLVVEVKTTSKAVPTMALAGPAAAALAAALAARRRA